MKCVGVTSDGNRRSDYTGDRSVQRVADTYRLPKRDMDPCKAELASYGELPGPHR